jgi:hypothetical protein
MRGFLVVTYSAVAIAFFIGTGLGDETFHADNNLVIRTFVSATWPISVGIVAGYYGEQMQQEQRKRQTEAK